MYPVIIALVPHIKMILPALTNSFNQGFSQGGGIINLCEFLWNSLETSLNIIIMAITKANYE